MSEKYGIIESNDSSTMGSNWTSLFEQSKVWELMTDVKHLRGKLTGSMNRIKYFPDRKIYPPRKEQFPPQGRNI